MHYFFVIVLSLQVGYSITNSESLQKNGSHNLLKLEKRNSSVQRPVRCSPCEESLRRPVSNHLEPEYRGNGADNLGYDWSPMAWGGPAFPSRSKGFMGGMRGRDGRMMVSSGGRNPENVRVVCDTCRTYWDGGRRDGGGISRGHGRQFDVPGQQNYFQGQPPYWQNDKMRVPDDYETRVMSPTVGVLVKPGSRIAYIPSRSGEMYWDGVSGGGTRWDGFSNGISWIGNAPEWDRSDNEPQNGPASSTPGSNYPYGSNSYGSYDNQKRPSWGDNLGRGYYFTNGVQNDIDPQWRDRGYASNWRYGFTNQNGWNGNNMKWNYGGKQWPDNDRSANRLNYNSFQDRTYGPTNGQHSQYGNQYPNYQSGGAGYPSNFRPQPSWPTGGGYRPNDRFPATFQPENYESGDKNRPWDYTSRDPFGQRRPGLRPGWERPGPSYPPPNNYVDNQGKLPSSYGTYNKFPTTDKNDYEKPWNRPSDYGPSKPGSGNSYPHGNRYPDEESGGGGRPNYPGSGGSHLFFPNTGNRQPSYSGTGSGSDINRPTYPGGDRKPGEYPSSGSHGGTYPAGTARPEAGYPDDKRPSVIYTGGRPMGSSSGRYPERPSYGGHPGGGFGGYPGGGTPPGEYPSTGSFVGGYPSAGGYPGRPVYPSGGGSYPGGVNRPDNYPIGGSYPGNRVDKYPSSSDGYQGGGGFSRPSGYPGGSAGGAIHPSGNTRPGFYPDEGYPNSGYLGGNRPVNYPGAGRPGEYGGERPDGYTGSHGQNYPVRGSSSSYPGGGKNPQKGYYTGFITELSPNDGQTTQYGGGYPTHFGSSYPEDKNFYQGKDRNKYFSGGNYPNGYPSGDKNRYPAYSEDRYSSGGSGGGSYNNQGGDRFYYGQSGDKGKYPGGYPSNHRFPNGEGDGFDRNQGSNNDKNSWNYGQNEHKDGIYRRSGGSYPPYRGGQYYTSSYLASMSTPAGSTQAGTEPKTQSVTKPDEVTQPTSDSS